MLNLNITINWLVHMQNFNNSTFHCAVRFTPNINNDDALSRIKKTNASAQIATQTNNIHKMYDVCTYEFELFYVGESYSEHTAVEMTQQVIYGNAMALYIYINIEIEQKNCMCAVNV